MLFETNIPEQAEDDHPKISVKADLRRDRSRPDDKSKKVLKKTYQELLQWNPQKKKYVGVSGDIDKLEGLNEKNF